MGLTVFQKLVLHALAILLWHSGEKVAARLYRGIALGHHTDSQKESAALNWYSKFERGGREGLPEKCADNMGEFE